MRRAPDQLPLVVGNYVLTEGTSEGTVWIGIIQGIRTGEGGDFDEKKLEEVIRKFYEENF